MDVFEAWSFQVTAESSEFEMTAEEICAHLMHALCRNAEGQAKARYSKLKARPDWPLGATQG